MYSPLFVFKLKSIFSDDFPSGSTPPENASYLFLENRKFIQVYFEDVRKT